MKSELQVFPAEPAEISAEHLEALVAYGARTTQSIRTAIAIGDPGFHHEVLDFVGRHPGLEIVASFGEADLASRSFTPPAPGSGDILLVCPRFGREVARTPGTRSPVLLVAEEMTVPVLRIAIEAGALGAFCWPEERSDLIDAIRSSAAQAARVAGPRGSVVAVLGSRGGAGATFLAAHLAAAFAQRGHRTALVDMDRSFGDLTAALGFIEGGVRSIEDLLPVVDELSPDHVSNALLRHQGGFDVLLARSEPSMIEAAAQAESADRPERREVPDGLFTACAALLAGEFDRVVLHLPRALGSLTRGAVRMADRIVLVTGLDLMALYGARRALDAMPSERVDGIDVVLNATRRPEVTPAEAERVLGTRAIARVRSDPAAAVAQARGRLIQRRRPAWRDVVTLARRLDEPRAEAEGSAS